MSQKRNRPAKPAPQKKRKKTTFRIDEELLTLFGKTIADLGLRRDVCLGRWIPDQLDRLKALPPNSKSAAAALAFLREGQEADSKRVSISLDSDLIDEMNRVCEEKRISRDAFLETFLRFLVSGPNELGQMWGGASPLGKALDLLDHPDCEWSTHEDDPKPYSTLLMSPKHADKIIEVIESMEDLEL